MNILNLYNRLAMGLIALVFSGSTHASPLFAGTTADAWLIDNTTGQLQGYNVNRWIEQYAADEFPGIVLGDSNVILVNTLQNSSKPMLEGQPSISLSGIGNAALSVGDSVSGLQVVPAGGTFDKTIAVTMRVNTALLRQGSNTLSWKIGAKPVQSITLNSQSTQSIQDGFYTEVFHLAEDGTYNVLIKLLAANGSTIESISASYKIAAGRAQLRRDTDGDGLPDLVELDIGLDPLTDDWDADTNEDGWKEVDTWLRKYCLDTETKTPVANDECLDSNGFPRDTDNDNWSDFDEVMRGTNPKDLEANVNENQRLRYKDYPTASRLYEVEYQIDNGSLQAPASDELNWKRADAVTINGKKLYDSDQLLSTDEVSEAGLTVEQVANRLTQERAEVAFTNNKLPAMRVPASDSVVINAVHRYHATDADEFDTASDYERIYKTWLPRKEDVTPKAMLEEVGEGNWTTADEWREAFIAYLVPRLTIIRNTNIDIESTLPVNVIEAVLTKESFLQGLSQTQLFVPSTLFGDLQFAKNWEQSIRRFYELNYSLDQSIIEISNALKAGKSLEAHKAWLQANFLEGNAGSRSDEVIIKQFLSEAEPADLLRQYLFRLVTLPNSRTRILVATSLLEPDVDTDEDDINNSDEINQAIDQLTLPWLNDSDGDSIPDGADECKNDPQNSCSDSPILPQVTLGLNFSVREPAGEDDVALVGIRLDQMANESVTIGYQTFLSATDTAAAGEDFTAVSGTVIIAAGQQSALIEVPILADANPEEGTETFSFQITTVENAVIADDGIVTITLNDNTEVAQPPELPSLEDVAQQIFTKGVAIEPLIFVNNGGGELTSCTADNLPTGLVITVLDDTSSCVISGVASQTEEAVVHTITAVNAAGSDTATVSIRVIDDASLAAPEITDVASQVYTKGIGITPLTFINTGGGELTFCDPEVIPQGLNIAITADGQTCEITGTPTEAQAATEHFFDVRNAAGVYTVSFNIEVIEPESNVSEWRGVEIAAVSNEINQGQQDHQVVMDSAGITWATWKQADGTNPNKNSIWVNRFSPDEGWGVAEKIETLDHDAETPAIAMNSSGNVIVVWVYKVPTPNSGHAWQLWGSHLGSNDDNWTTPIRIYGGTDGAGLSPRVPQLSMDESGKALLVWHMRTASGGGFELMSSYYTPEASLWELAEEIGISYDRAPPKLAMNENGHAISVWREKITILSGGFGVRRDIIKGRIFDPRTGWEGGDSQVISFADETTAGNGSTAPEVAIDASGNAIVAWFHHKNLPDSRSETNLWARHYNVSDGWGVANLVETNQSKYMLSPQVAMNDSGNGMVVWVEKTDFSGLSSVWVNIYTQNDGWSGAQEVESSSGWQNAFPAPQIGMDESGNAVAVWLKRESRINYIEAISFNVQASNWGVKETIGLESKNTDDPHLVANSQGKVLVLWNSGYFSEQNSLKSNFFEW